MSLQAAKVDALDYPLNFGNLPKRKSLTASDEPPRLSYYNEHLAVPFKWEAAPGKPMNEKSPTRPECTKLRPPPILASKYCGAKLNDDDGGDSDLESIASFHWMTGPFTRDSTDRSSPTTTAGNIQSNTRSAKSSFRLHNLAKSRTPTVTPLTRWSSRHEDSKRSDFDWPEVSDDDDTSDERVGKEGELERQGSKSSAYFSSTPSSSDNSGSQREIDPVRKYNYIPAAPLKSETVELGGNFASVNEDEDHEVRPSRGMFSCLPIFRLSRVRMIQSQLNMARSAVRRTTSPSDDFSHRLSPGIKYSGD